MQLFNHYQDDEDVRKDRKGRLVTLRDKNSIENKEKVRPANYMSQQLSVIHSINACYHLVVE
jgi:hypothetical protein